MDMAAPIRQFSDLNLNMLIHPVTGDVDILKNVDAVKRSIRNLILTNNYERHFQPDIGSGIAHLLFEPIGPLTRERIRNAIESTIKTYEPRAEVLKIDVKVDTDGNGYNASITFGMVNLIEPVTISLFLERVR